MDMGEVEDFLAVILGGLKSKADTLGARFVTDDIEGRRRLEVMVDQMSPDTVAEMKREFEELTRKGAGAGRHESDVQGGI